MGKVISDSMGKVWENRTFQGHQVFLISWEAEIHTIPKIQNMEKVYFHNTGKVWENKNISNLLVS